mgnify:CR=1 FL=1
METLTKIILALILIIVLILLVYYYNIIDNMRDTLVSNMDVSSHAKINMLPIRSIKNVSEDKLLSPELLLFHKNNYIYMDIMNWLGDYYLSNTPINRNCSEAADCKLKAKYGFCTENPEQMLYNCPSSCGTCNMPKVQKDAIRNILIYKNNFDENDG